MDVGLMSSSSCGQSLWGIEQERGGGIGLRLPEMEVELGLWLREGERGVSDEVVDDVQTGPLLVGKVAGVMVPTLGPQ